MNPKEGFIVPCSNWTECQEAQEGECAPCQDTTLNPDVNKGVTIAVIKAICMFMSIRWRQGNKINTRPAVI